MHPILFARTNPSRSACIDADRGDTLSYGLLNDRANQCANAFRRLGLNRGDVVAVLLDNGFDISRSLGLRSDRDCFSRASPPSSLQLILATSPAIRGLGS